MTFPQSRFVASRKAFSELPAFGRLGAVCGLAFRRLGGFSAVDTFRRLGTLSVLGVIFCLGLLCLPQTADATRGVKNYPRVCQLASTLGEYDDAMVDSLAWYDLVAFSSSPWMVDRVRDRNPDIELLFHWMPQTIYSWGEDDTSWFPDTTWNVIRLAEFYAMQNDWYLRDTEGERIPEWTGWASNWTRYCPKGTYGTSKGMTYAEWLAEVAIPRFVNGEAEWEAWGPGSSAYQGFLFEVFADCVGSFGYMNYADADPDRDGLPEGVSHGCTSGGAQDSLSILFRETNAMFGPELIDIMGDDLIVIINPGNKYIAPSWHKLMTGQKLEAWLQSPPHPAWHTWWKYFYELTTFDGTDRLEVGYLWAEQNMGSTGRDDIDGWDRSMIQVDMHDHYSPSEIQRWKRFGLSTSMLGDGFFSITTSQQWPHWQPEFDWDFGEPLGDFTIETYPVLTAADSVYVRLFEKGMVEVNPNNAYVKTIPAKDGRFTFWQPVTDLLARSVGGTTVRLDFTASDEARGPIDAYRVRYAPWPITLANWNSATEAIDPIVSDPDHAVSVLVRGLPATSTLYFAVRNEVHTDLELAISNVVSATTGAPQADQTPPGAITNVTLDSVGETEATLEWTAPGDDGFSGRAALYEIRFRRGPAITSESAWEESEKIVDRTPLPAMAGQTETFTVTELVSGTLHAFAIRTYDEAGNLSPLSNPFTIVTNGVPPPALDDQPPGKITNLQVALIDSTAVELTWTAPGDDSYTGQATAYEVRALAGHAIVTKVDWNTSGWPDNPIPAPKTAGSAERFRFEGLTPETLYGFAVRAIDDQGLIGSVSNSPTATTLESAPPDPPDPPDPPPPPPDPMPPSRIVDLSITELDSTHLVLHWTAPDDGDGSAVAAYEVAMLVGDSLITEADWDLAERIPGPDDPNDPGELETLSAGDLEPATLHSFAIRSVDVDSLWSEISNVIYVTTLGPPPPPPDPNPPNPIEDLSISFYDSTRVRLSWRAPDDGEGGRVSTYLIGVLAGDSLLTLDDWDRAEHLPGPPPSMPGFRDSHLLTGLDPSTLHGFVVRSTDGEERLSALSNSMHVVTLDPPDPPDPDTTEPDPITDLAASNVTETSARLTWTATGDDGDEGSASQYRLFRESAGSVDSTVLALVPSDAGETESYTVNDLDPGTSYELWLVASDDAGNRSGPSNHAVANTPGTPPPPPPEVDTTPPAAVDEVTLVAESATRLRITWSAVGDDGDQGDPTLYRVGFLSGGVIASETAWSNADTSAVCPPPAPVGEDMVLVLTNLVPGTEYGIAVRAVDEEGLRSPLSTELAEILMPAASDTMPPHAVFDLKYERVGMNWVDLVWTAPSDPPSGDPALRYQLGFRSDGPLEDEDDWSLATFVTTGLPDPATPGEPELVRVTALLPATVYSFAVRAEDTAGNLSDLSGALSLMTLAGGDGGDDPGDDDPGDGGDDPDDGGDDPGDGGDDPDDGGDDPGDGGDDPDDGGDPGDGGDDPDDGGDDPDDGGDDPDDGGDDPGDGGDDPDDGGDDPGDGGDDPDDGGDDPDDGGDDPGDDDPGDGGDDASIPSPILDVTVTDRGPTWVLLEWTATGEDGDTGSAASYRVRYRRDDPMLTEADWEHATPIEEGLPDPSPSGQTQQFRLDGLNAHFTYVICLRAIDAEGQLSRFVPSITILPYDVPPPAAPLAVTELSFDFVEPRRAQLRLQHPEVPTGGTSISYYVIGIASNPITESNWSGVGKFDGAPTPGIPGSEAIWILSPLQPDTRYYVAVRSRDLAGTWSPLSPVLELRTPGLDLSPPDAPRGLEVGWMDDGRMHVTWSPSTDSRVVGYHVYAEGLVAGWSRLTTEPVTDTEFLSTRPNPEAAQRLAVTSVLGNGSESSLSGPLSLFAAAWKLDGPFPHPVRESCRFEVSIPWEAGGSMQILFNVLDVTGARVRSLGEREVFAGQVTEWTWDRTDDRGRRVAPGYYYVRVKGGEQEIVKTVYVAP